MPQINKLSASDTLEGGDLLPVYVSNQGDVRKVSAATLLGWLQNNLTFPGGFGSYATQYSSPSATGFSVQLTDNKNDNTNIHLILTPTSGYAAGTIVLPPVAGLTDRQEVLINCTQQVNALTIDPNGATAVTGAPALLGADDFFRLKYDLATKTWYRVG